MKKNFYIKDGVIFSFLSDSVDIRAECELASVEFSPGDFSRVRLDWNLEKSNSIIRIDFNYVEEFVVKGRDSVYPLKAGKLLAIAGFVDIKSFGPESEFCLEPDQSASYMSFAMDDMSAFLVRAGTADMRRV